MQNPSDQQLTVIVVTYNSERYIDPLFQSMRDQTFRDFSVIVVDNRSEDHTLTRIDAQKGISITLVRNRTNLGFSKGYNKGIALADSEYVLIANPDIVFDRECFQKLLDAASRHPHASIFGPKITRYPNPDIIDTAGMEIFTNRRVLNRGEGDKDLGQYDKEEEVFGIAGTVMLFRASHIKDIAFEQEEIFDEHFFMYKEDVDLAWRAQTLGKTSVYVPTARAVHVRTAQKYGGHSDIIAIQSRRTKSGMVRFLSTRNHWALLYKNERFANFLFNFPHIFLFEVKKILYLSIFEPLILIRAVSSFMWMFPTLYKKRRWIKQHSQRSAPELRKLFHHT